MYSAAEPLRNAVLLVCLDPASCRQQFRFRTPILLIVNRIMCKHFETMSGNYVNPDRA